MTTKTRKRSGGAPASNNGFSLISDAKLLQIYGAMVNCRMIAERAQALFPQDNFPGDEVAAKDAESGLEAVAAGVAVDLLPDDTVAGAHRGLFVPFMRGEPLNTLFNRLSDRATHPNISAQLKAATDAAMNSKQARNSKIAVAFSGSGAAPLGFWQEALSTAGFHRLPMLFVCAVQQTPLYEAGEIARKAEAGGLPGIVVDGSDAVAVYRVATEAIAHARKGNGATLIECSLSGEQDDPIPKMEAYLVRKGLFRKETRQEIAAAFSRELEAALGTLSPASVTFSRSI